MRKAETDWDELFKWLENGYEVQDVAAMLGVTSSCLCNRARRQLSPEEYQRWKGISKKTRLAPCGTYGAYLRHQKRGEEIDEECRLAWTVYCHRKTEERKQYLMTPEKIDSLYRRPLTKDDRKVLRRLLRNEMKRLGYPFGQRDQFLDDLFMDDNQRQVYRIFMSVAAESEGFYAQHPELRNRSDDASSPEK